MGVGESVGSFILKRAESARGGFLNIVRLMEFIG